MQREIKFRAWSDRGQCMSYIDDLYWFEEEGVPEVCDHIGMGHNDSFQIMQFTGLRDKEGKEIYERDILKTHHFTDCAGRKYSLYHIVVWDDKITGWRARHAKSKDNNDGSPPLWVYMKNSDPAIVGNIYETPELLEDAA